MEFLRALVAAVRNISSKGRYPCSHYILSIADTRTDDGDALGIALIQHQHIGVLPTNERVLEALPLLDPLTSTSMPESWVRGAILIRMNSLLRGHSAVRWEVIQAMGALLENNITPMVPLRGSISASGGKLICALSHNWVNASP